MDMEILNEAFRSFTTASKSLESYYGSLQEKVGYLTAELEAKNRQLNTALEDAERSKDYLNAVLYNLEEAIIVVDPQGRISLANKSAEILLGCPAASITGRDFSSLDLLISTEGADTIFSSNGKKYTIILSRSQLVDAAGVQQGSVILIRDITRLREMELYHERNQRLVSMGEMAATIVHEIRNPLCTIELFSSMLEKDLSDTSQKELAGGISTGINNLNNILTNMLFFARPQKPDMKDIRLDKVIEDSVLIFRSYIESREVKVFRSLFDCSIKGDSELLKQVFMNVIVNAVQSMPEGGEINIKMRDMDLVAGVDIIDNGAGIRREYIEKIFDPFFSTKDRGTGLGLAIASRIVQAHEGYITVNSGEGRGSTFTLCFPKGRVDGNRLY